MKIEIYCNKKYKINKYKLIQATVFFVNDVFKEHLETPDLLSVNLLSYNQYKAKSAGRFYVGEEKSLFCDVNLDEVNNLCNHKLCFKNFHKSLFFVILHELGHAYYFLSQYKIKNIKNSLEEYHSHNFEIVRKIYEENNNLSEGEISRLIPEEIEADKFALKNLNYFKNLYDYDGFLV